MHTVKQHHSHLHLHTRPKHISAFLSLSLSLSVSLSIYLSLSLSPFVKNNSLNHRKLRKPKTRSVALSGLSKNTGGSPLLENMELLQEDESSLGLGQQGMESAPTPRETVGPYLARSPYCLFVCLPVCISVYLYVTLSLPSNTLLIDHLTRIFAPSVNM